MKKLALMGLLFCSLKMFGIGQIERLNEERDLKEVARMVAIHDDTHTVMPSARTYAEKEELITKALQEPRDNFIIKDDNGVIIAFLTLIKRPSLSKQMARELDDIHSVFKNLLLSMPDLPETSDSFIIRPTLIIAKAYRRQGIGRRLMEHALKEASEKSDVAAIELQVAIDHTPAITLYTSLGYKELFRNEELGSILFRKETNIA